MLVQHGVRRLVDRPALVKFLVLNVFFAMLPHAGFIAATPTEPNKGLQNDMAGSGVCAFGFHFSIFLRYFYYSELELFFPNHYDDYMRVLYPRAVH